VSVKQSLMLRSITRFMGSRRTTLSIDAARTEFEAGIETVLGELKRAICDTLLKPDEDATMSRCFCNYKAVTSSKR
jgi:hypothetical protein